MPTKKTTAKKAVKKAVRSFKVSFQGIGTVPEDISVKPAKSTFGDFKDTICAERNIDSSGYQWSLNGSSSKTNSTPLAKGDVIRLGLKTKNA